MRVESERGRVRRARAHVCQRGIALAIVLTAFLPAELDDMETRVREQGGVQEVPADCP